MIKVNSKVTINAQRMKQLTSAAQTALELTAEELHTEIVQAQVVPRMDGALQGEKMYVDTSGSGNGTVAIIHEGPYARRLYYHPEYHFHRGPWSEEYKDKDGKVHRVNHDGNPNAKAHWFRDWEPGGSKEQFAPSKFKEHYRRLAGL
ncbi:MAG: hypothetical protein SOT28_01580 [Fusicatenibacter sp.]|nr:hypothetical protein [Lachnospiraceae bacterium]MDY2936998.1 hypothetical protein [Fusicatenibacter sp.]